MSVIHNSYFFQETESEIEEEVDLLMSRFVVVAIVFRKLIVSITLATNERLVVHEIMILTSILN